VTVKTSADRQESHTSKFIIALDGVYHTEGGDGLKKYACRFKLPVKVGSEWDAYVRAKATVVAREEITVPIGKLEAVRVDLTSPGAFTLSGAPISPITEWYVLGIGMVKRSTEVRDIVMTSFTKGKSRQP
jgi:hypothetical protein